MTVCGLWSLNRDRKQKIQDQRLKSEDLELFSFHQFNEALKVVLGIVRAGRSFGMVLHGDDRQGAMPHSFDALVVEIQVSDLDFTR